MMKSKIKSDMQYLSAFREFILENGKFQMVACSVYSGNNIFIYLEEITFH